MVLSMVALAAAAWNVLPVAYTQRDNGKAIAAESGAQPIRIAFITSMSGQSGHDGPQMINGFKLYLDQVGNKFAGRPVELQVENDESNPSTGVGKLRKVIEQDKVDMATGFILAHISYPASELAEKDQFPFIIALSGADDVTKRKKKNWVIRTGWSSSQMSMPLGEYAAKVLHYKKVVTIGSDYAHPYEVVGGFQKTFEENGGKVIQKLWAPLGFTDFKDILKQIKPDADAVFLAIVGQSTEIIPKQYRELGFKMPIIASTVTCEESVFPASGQYLRGAISSEPYSAALDSPANKKFVKAYMSKFKEQPSWYSASGYTVAAWMDKTAQAVKGNFSNKAAVLAAMKSVQLPDDPRGPLKLDDYGQVDQNIYIRRVDKVGEWYQNTVIHTYPKVSQFYKYSPEEFMKEPPFTKDYPPCKYCTEK
jgi:branched-chain amino acid transport system substrate-binding protein